MKIDGTIYFEKKILKEKYFNIVNQINYKINM